MPKTLVMPFIFALAPLSAMAQNASPTAPTPVRVLALGGFLGQLDGFCEEPGGTYDSDALTHTGFLGCADENGQIRKEATGPVMMGGLMGGRAWMASRKSSSDVLVVTGNNQVANFTFLRQSVLAPPEAFRQAPPDRIPPELSRLEQTTLRFRRFWQEMNLLGADAIGLASEDFVRSLRDPRDNLSGTSLGDRGSLLHRWLRQVTDKGAGIPIIGSNVVIKTRNRHLGDLNVVEKGGYALSGLADDESVGWLSELKVGHPERTGIALSLWEIGPIGGADALQQVGTATTAGGTSTTVKPAGGTLKPAYRYEVRARDGSVSETMTFQTHIALTPRRNDVPRLDGFPIVTKKWVEGSPLLIVALVDPSVKSLLGKDAWSWNRKPCTDADMCEWRDTCPEEQCEIDVVPPADALKTLIQRTYLADTDRKPFIILISALDDAKTEELLEAYPEIRMVVLPPESAMLGRASRAYPPEDDTNVLEERLARRSDKRAFSGDLGMVGIFNPDRAQGTTVVVRPEWIGETAADMSATVSYSDRFEWILENEKASVTAVPGAALTWTGAKCPPGMREGVHCTAFSAVLPSRTVDYGVFPSYRVCEGRKPGDPGEDECAMLARLENEGEFQMFAGDALRGATGAELAIVPGGLIDSDAHTWLRSVVDPTHTRMLTRFVLERAIYRSFRIVRATVSGDQLVATLDKALKAQSHAGSCIVGLSDACSESVDTKRADIVKINGRAIDARLHYTIAIPEGLAEELALPHSDNVRHTTDAVSAINARLEGDGRNGWYVRGSGDTLAPRIARQGRQRPQHYLLASSLEFGYTSLDLDPDPGVDAVRDKQLQGLDVEFRSVTPATRLTRKADLDLAVVDLAWGALRGIATVDLSRRTDFKTPINEIAFERNTFTIGARADLKLPLFKREARVYYGRFLEGEIEGPPVYLTAQIDGAVVDGFSRTKKASSRTVYQRNPLQFGYHAVGADVLNQWKVFSQTKIPVDVTKVSMQFAWGRLNHVPKGVLIDGRPYEDPAKTFKDVGAAGLLNSYFAAHEFDFNPDVSLVAIEESRDQRRYQAEFNFSPKVAVGPKTWAIGAEVRYRYYTKSLDSDSLRSAWRTRLSLSLPIVPRLEVVPAVEYHVADIQASNSGRFTHFKFETTVKVPFVIKAGWGWLLQ